MQQFQASVAILFLSGNINDSGMILTGNAL